MEYTLTELDQPLQLYGLWADSSDKRQHKDIDALARTYHETVGTKAREVYPFCIVNAQYDEVAQAFRLFVGSDKPHEGLQAYQLPCGQWARIEVPVRIGLLSGMGVGRAKRWFYQKALPMSGYAARDITYEWHTKNAAGKPVIAVYFAIEKK